MTTLAANLSLMFAEVPMAERFGLAQLYGFDSVEIQFPYDHEAEWLADLARRADVRVGLINIPAGGFLDGGEGLAAVPSRQQDFAAALQTAAEYAATLNTGCVNVIPGRCLDESKEPDYLSTYKENLAFAANFLAGRGIACVFEAINRVDMPRFLIHSHQQQLEIVQHIQHPNLFAQVDIYHLATSVGLDRLRESLLEILPITRHIQFADWPGRGEPGTGSIDFTTVLNEIRASGYNGFVAAEYKPTRDTPMTLEWLPMFRKLLNAN